MLLLSIYVYRHRPMFHLDFNGYLIVRSFISAWLVAFGAVNASTCNVLSIRALRMTSEFGSFLLIAATFLLSLVATLPIAAISYRLIEKPGIRCEAAIVRTFGRTPVVQSSHIAA
jgi:hypothetical protein